MTRSKKWDRDDRGRGTVAPKSLESWYKVISRAQTSNQYRERIEKRQEKGWKVWEGGSDGEFQPATVRVAVAFCSSAACRKRPWARCDLEEQFVCYMHWKPCASEAYCIIC